MEIDTIKEIFDVLYLIRYKQIDYLTVEDIKMYGSLTTGNKDVDKMQAEQWITTMLPISKIAELHNDGVRLKVVKYEDTKKMYEIITLHLNAWKDKMRYMIHDNRAPIDDLIKLDKLAVVVYEHAKHQFTKEIVSSIFEHSVFGGPSIDSIFNTKKLANTVPELAEKGLVKSVDYTNTHHTEIFKEDMSNLHLIVKRY